MIDDVYPTRQEFGNPEDEYPVCVTKHDDTIVGHVPRELSRTFWYFLTTDGEISCQVKG